MDFKEDQLAIEAHVRMRSGWRDMDEISEEEYLMYAYEYMEEHSFESWLVFCLPIPGRLLCAPWFLISCGYLGKLWKAA